VTPLLTEKGIVLTTAVQDATVRVEYDLLKTLLLNLVDNAVKASATELKLSGAVEGTRYCVSLQDNGCGMAEKELSRITEAFYMVDKSRSRRQHGAGIGLSIAAKIAAIHGTELQFASRVGVGTTVSLSLAAQEAPNE
jgi:signal transduction histidine kinase